MIARPVCKSGSRTAIALLAASLGLGLALTPSARPSASTLRQGVASARQHEQSLASGVAHASRVIGALSASLSILSGRVAAVESQLAADQAALTRLVADVARERGLASRLQARFVARRVALKRWLVAIYERGRPDVLGVLFNARSFSDLLERLDFERRLSEQDAVVTRRTREARDTARRAATRLTQLSAAQARATAGVQAERNALAGIGAALAARRQALARVRVLQVAELHGTHARRLRLERRLAAVLATPSFGPAPPGTSFAIPWPIVQCESSGQNLPPNSAGASGYYQILPATWKQYGGTTAQAYQASKAEQDQVAARIWNGGAGASNWVCAGLVQTR